MSDESNLDNNHADEYWEQCWNCEDGFVDHDCGEDTCCCLYPEDNVVCDICGGEMGWYVPNDATSEK